MSFAGMHYAVKQSCLDIEVVCAFDINIVANDVYQFNHGRRPYQVTGASAKLWVDLACMAIQRRDDRGRPPCLTTRL